MYHIDTARRGVGLPSSDKKLKIKLYILYFFYLRIVVLTAGDTEGVCALRYNT
jgi:hypothetical protein